MEQHSLTQSSLQWFATTLLSHEATKKKNFQSNTYHEVEMWLGLFFKIKCFGFQQLDSLSSMLIAILIIFLICDTSGFLWKWQGVVHSGAGARKDT